MGKLHARTFGARNTGGLTIAISMVLLAGCSGSNSGDADEATADSSISGTDTSTREADPVTNEQLSTAIGSITVGGSPLTVETASAEELNSEDFSDLTDQLSPDAFGVTPPECADVIDATGQNQLESTGDGVSAYSSGAPTIFIIAVANAADQADFSARPECATIQVGPVTHTEVDAPTNADDTVAYTSYVNSGDDSRVTMTSITATYRDALINIIGYGNLLGGTPAAQEMASEAPPITYLQAVVNQVVATLG